MGPVAAVPRSLRWACALMLCCALAAQQKEGFKQTWSQRPYAHHLELLDAAGRPVDPSADRPQPYSPTQTCKTCHDVERMSHGLHSNAALDPARYVGDGAEGLAAWRDADRPGEPWIHVDRRTGTVIPISLRGDRPGAYRPEALDLDPLALIRAFGRHAPGGGATAFGRGDDAPRAALTGEWALDCMACHGAGRTWSQDHWAEQLEAENLQWAPAVALGLAAVEGTVKGMAEDATAETLADKGPRLRYDPSRFDADGKVFFDVVRRPENSACLGCHSEHRIDGRARWQHDGDVHLRAGMSCVDCHRSGVDHHTVRGHEGELRPDTLEPVEALSCRGCHEAGRLGAPEPVHAGLPPLHLEALSCTACHAGPAPDGPVIAMQTARAHALGLPDQRRTEADPPTIAGPVLVRDDDGVLRPMRQMWPTFWAVLRDGDVTPLSPEKVTNPLRRALRIRRELAEVLGETDESAKAAIAKGLEGLTKALEGELGGGEVVFASGGSLWRRSGEDGVVPFDHEAAQPYRWPIGHDVRPARLAAGAGGCADCHGEGAPFLAREVAAGNVPLGPLVDQARPAPTTMTVAGLDPELMGAWQQAFTARDLFKWIGFGALGLILLVVVYELVAALGRAMGWLGRRGEVRS